MVRPTSSTRLKTTDYRSIDIAWLRRRGARNLGCSGRIRWTRDGEVRASIGYALEGAGLRLSYRITPAGGTPEHVDELIPIITTPMHLGGHRHWFACPSCRRRCRILYGGARFRCRLCRGAAYESQYENPMIRAAGMRWRIRERLEERGSKLAYLCGLDDWFPDKPPRMHWSTYHRLEAQDRRLAARSEMRAKEWFGRGERQRQRTAKRWDAGLRALGLALPREPNALRAPARTKTPRKFGGPKAAE